MNELVYLKHDEVVCDSLQVAEKFGKRHDRVLRAIEQIKNDSSPQKWGQSFKEKSYKDSSGELNKMYEMNRDGFSICPFLRWRLLMYNTGKCVLSTTIWTGAGVVSLLRCCLLGSRKRLLNTF